MASPYINIILASFFLVLLYLLYKLYNRWNSNKVISKVLYLKNGKTVIPSSQLQNISSMTSSISVWVYFNSFNTRDKKTIFQIGTPINKYYELYVDAQSTALNFDILNSKYTFTITNSLPLQKWTNIFINVSNNQVFEFYLNGKLMQSNRVNDNIQISGLSDLTIGGDTNPDIIVTNFMRWPKNSSSTEIWKNYLKGNGIFTPGFNAVLSMTEDTNVIKSYSLFNRP